MNGKKIMVPLDGSRFGEFALPHALSMARVLETGVELVSVVSDIELVAVGDPAVAAIPPSVLEEERWRFGEYLKDVAGRIKDVSQVDVSTRVLRGDITMELEGHAESGGIGLIVICSHGRGPFSRAWLGSVADELMRHAPVPVLIIRPDEDGEPVLSEEHPCNRILVPLDGTELAEHGLKWARKIAAPKGSALELVWVVRPAEPFQSPYLPEVVTEVKVTGEIGRSTATEYLDGIAELLLKSGVRVGTHVIDDMQVASGILHCAGETGSDLISIATHGRGGLARVALGSVTDKVIRGANVPVLVARG